MLNFKRTLVLLSLSCWLSNSQAHICETIVPKVVGVFDAITANNNTHAVELHNSIKQYLHGQADVLVYTTMLGLAQESYGVVERKHLTAYLTSQCLSMLTDVLAKTH